MQINIVVLERVTKEAKRKASAHPSWLRAIDRAAEELRTNPYISQEQDGSLLILSPSGKTYHSNGSCQCEAYRRGLVCWHRACAQLARRYKEAVANDRETLIAGIKGSWERKYPHQPIGLALLKRFGTNQLANLDNGILRQIYKAFSTDDLALERK
jgi:hypothetical protein